MPSFGCYVAIQPGRTGDRGYEQVQCTIAVDVSADEAPGNGGAAAEGAVVMRDIAKPAVALIGEELVAFRIGAPKRARRAAGGGGGRRWALDTAIYQRQVRSAVVIEVGQYGAEPGAAPAGIGQTQPDCPILEQAARPLLPQGVGFVRQMGDEDIEQAIAVHVANGDSHIRLRFAHGFVSDAARHSLLLERAVALVDPQMVRPGVVGYEDVGPAVAVEVGAENP